VHLLRYVVKCTVIDCTFNTQTSCLNCPPSAWIHFLTCVTRVLVTLQSTAALLMLLAMLRICWSSSFLSLHHLAADSELISCCVYSCFSSDILETARLIS